MERDGKVKEDKGDKKGKREEKGRRKWRKGSGPFIFSSCARFSTAQAFLDFLNVHCLSFAQRRPWRRDIH